ncbi:MAG: radical SAM protein [Planctomycetes bacterium]|nr:radical SAM protein [Planctomycetota bacterium]
MYLRVSVTDRCNLRCTYCLPEDARFAPSRATAEELDRLMAAVCASAPVTKIRLTGGEPTICPSLLQHIRTAAWLVPTVGMTTNGVALERLLPELRNAGLTRLNISLDAADADGFRRAARHDHFMAVLASIRAARRTGFTPLKLNAVATMDTDPAALARLAIAEGAHLRFIELMDIGIAHADWSERHITAEVLRERLASAGLAITEDSDRDEPTSRVWTVDGVDPSATTLGFITTVTNPFCATCDRIRLTSQGRLHTCLFDERGTDLLPLLRAGNLAGLDIAIRRAIGAKAPPLRFQRSGMMAGIGG